MKVTVSTLGTFHYFDLARQLYKKNVLAGIFTAYPLFKLKNCELPKMLIHSYPWFQTLYMRKGILGPFSSLIDSKKLGWIVAETLDKYTAAHLPECDVYIGQARAALYAGQEAKRRGYKFVSDRGSAHTIYREDLLEEESKKFHVPFLSKLDKKSCDKELEEFELADVISVPSSFVYRSFIEKGFSESKLRKIPYGVDLSVFSKVSDPNPDSFDILFVGGASLRKGVPYLLEAFKKFDYKRKTLTFVGTINSELQELLSRYIDGDQIKFLGHYPHSKLREVMSRSHVMVLPSIEEGLALVQGQALACGCPVICTPNTGGEDLFDNEVEGFIVPIRDSQAIADRLQLLADNPNVRNRMSFAALEKVKSLGGWNSYGDKIIAMLDDIVAR